MPKWNPQCETCGETFVRTNLRKVNCNTCYRAENKIYMKEYYEKTKNEPISTIC